MLSKRLTDLVPYVAGEQPKDRQYIKLNTNENPFPPPPVIGELLKNYDYSALRLYPGPTFDRLRNKMGEVYGLDAKNIFVCNGSDEGLSFCFYAFFDNAWGKVLFPNYTYSFYPVYCDFYALEYKKIPLTADYTIDPDLYLREEAAAGIIFPNPNAPTGILLDKDKIAYLLKNFPPNRVVIVDEAYIDFGGETVLPILSKHKNLLIVRTFSKAFSFAGLRLGYLFGDEVLIDALFRVKDSFNSYPVNRLTQEMAYAAMEHYAAFQQNNLEVIAIREAFTVQLKKLGWEVLPSGANFVFTRKPGSEGKTLAAKLKAKGILVRNFSTKGIEDFLRISMGSKAEMDTLIGALGDI